mmetsp:Transcript_10294/g.28043  ORF Transcript_10294/g.28043 Transcript_10294/m.28043 type:complete len:297 (-) Transcript_10294:1897-2787(-)
MLVQRKLLQMAHEVLELKPVRLVGLELLQQREWLPVVGHPCIVLAMPPSTFATPLVHRNTIGVHTPIPVAPMASVVMVMAISTALARHARVLYMLKRTHAVGPCVAAASVAPPHSVLATTTVMVMRVRAAAAVAAAAEGAHASEPISTTATPHAAACNQLPRRHAIAQPMRGWEAAGRQPALRLQHLLVVLGVLHGVQQVRHTRQAGGGERGGHGWGEHGRYHARSQARNTTATGGSCHGRHVHVACSIKGREVARSSGMGGHPTHGHQPWRGGRWRRQGCTEREGSGGHRGHGGA